LVVIGLTTNHFQLIGRQDTGDFVRFFIFTADRWLADDSWLHIAQRTKYAE